MKGKIYSITGLATTPTLNVVGNRIPNVSNLVEKAYCNANIFDIEAKYFTISNYNEFANDVLNAKTKKKN